jgi:hypothetical protein
MPGSFIQPNLYILSGGGLNVTYSTSGFDGQPHFSYNSASLSRNYTGNEIQTVSTILGTLVSVFILQTVDSGSTSFTVLIPVVNLNSGETGSISTEGITAHHKFSVFSSFMHGQIETYNVQALTGTAQHVVF